ncbi:hypothetical protein B4073_4344 [Bacillus subtilis]|nr:hypothetical protein B4068_4227 [Bacillus subtilis]KIN43290.1 hypothetical protein B4073_4344 [Bacillus subtilis]KZD76877.1 hypothetical protein B4417_4133 [Bacillus subtilis]
MLYGSFPKLSLFSEENSSCQSIHGFSFIQSFLYFSSS